MIFTSFEFLIFFLAVLVFRNCFKDLGREKWFLLVASYVFYGSWSLPCLGLILFTSSADYLFGRWLWQAENPATRRGLLILSLVVNLGMLVFFKYSNFVLQNVSALSSALGWPLHLPHYNILLPAGISFFTFQSMSYTIDVYRRHLRPCENWRDFLLFVSFFPQLLAGPIVRAAEFLPQLTARVRAKVRDVESGLFLFAVGAVKKTVISDQISPHVDVIFASPGQFDALTLLQGVIGYALQIYCDFSGYSDMAIGSARILGFHFPDNFRMPYSATDITEFWRRWHISLSTWLRDYLYIPLGGNRRGHGRTYFNLMVTMLLGGLWHGASWNFIVWGGLHGAALAAHKFWRQWRGETAASPSGVGLHLRRTVSWATTSAVVLLGWVFFRAQTFHDAGEFLRRVLTWETDGTRLLSPHILAAVVGVVLAHLLIHKDRDWAEELPARPVLVRVLVYAAFLALIVSLGATDAAPFIYFQF